MIPFLLTALLTSPVSIDETHAVFRGGAWLARLGGTVADGGSPINFETNIDLNDKEASALLEFELEPIEDVRIHCSFFDFGTSGGGTFSGNTTYSGVQFNNGDAWAASTDLQSVGIHASLDWITPYEAASDITLSFAPVVGFRWFGIHTELERTASSDRVIHQTSFTSIQGGFNIAFRWNLEDRLSWLDAVSLRSEFLGGVLIGNDGGSVFSIIAGFNFEFSPIVAGYFGYRLQELNGESGTYVFDAGLQGLYVGGQILF